MDTEIELVKQEIRKVEEQIDLVEGHLTQAVKEDDIAYFRKKTEQLRREEEQLREKEEQLREKEERKEKEQLRKKELPLLEADDVVDRSQYWIEHMLLPQLPELPKNKADLTKVLFPQQHGKIPVAKKVYKHVAVSLPKLAAEVLVEADDSELPLAMGFLLTRQYKRGRTEMHTSIVVGLWLTEIFDLFESYSDVKLILEFSFNSNEWWQGSRSQTSEVPPRPDTIVKASGCTLLVGEDKVADLHAGEADIISKIKALNSMFYGEMNFILGYIAAGTQFQWVYIGKNGAKDLHRVGECLDLSRITDRCSFALSVGYAFQLLKTMTDSVPDVLGRRAMFSKEESLDGQRVIWFHPDKVVKHIRDFDSYSADQRTSLSEIQRAYGAAEGGQFLLQAVTGPTVNAHGTYKVQCRPLGYSCSLNSEHDCRWMAHCVCQALRVLHGAGLVHRDVRLPNIMRLSEMHFMLIDLESVAHSPFTLNEGFRHFLGWNPRMFEGRQYTPLSDMYRLGELLNAELPDGRTALAESFIRKLTSKQLSASDALQDPWLSDLMQ